MDVMQEEPVAIPPKPQRRALRAFLVALAVIVAFGAGYVPKELDVRRLRAELQQTQVDLRLADLHRRLGMAMEEAQRNNFANAVNEARAFFDGCRALAGDPAFAEQPRTRTALETYAGYAGDLIPRLQNADPGTKESLAGLYRAMDGVLQRRL